MKHAHVLYFSAVISASLQAEHFNTDDLFQLSIDELMDLEVVTVSRRAESFKLAPGVLTVVTKQEIDSFGARSVKDLLLRLPNLYLFDSSIFKASGSMLRGGATQHLNNHVLYLIDGRPVRESQNGGLHTDINLLFPVSAIERIEIIRGPGSVLYGSNAFNGTINFITKKASKQSPVLLSAERGSNQYAAISAGFSTEFSDSGYVSIFGNHVNDNGQLLKARDERGNEGQQRTAYDGSSVLFKAGAAGLDITYLKTDMTYDTVSGAFFWTGEAKFDIERDYVNVGYDIALTESWNARFDYTQNKQTRFIYGANVNTSSFTADGYLYDLTINGTLTETVSLALGAVVEKVRGDLDIRGGDYNTTRKQFFTQFDYQVTDTSELIVGAQWNSLDSGESDVSPRVALVSKLSNHWVAKLMYAEAYRAPYGSELFFVSPFLNGDSELSSEKIATKEAQLQYQKDNLAISSTYYVSQTSNAIGRGRVNGVTTFVNDDMDVDFYGVEVEWNWRFNEQINFQGNASYQTSEDSLGQDDVLSAANSMLKFGLAYSVNDAINVSIWNSYFGAANKLEELANSTTNVVNPRSDSFNLVSVNATADLATLFGPEFEGFNASLFVNNAFDEQVWYPDLNRKQVNTFPQNHISGVFLKLGYQF